MKQVLLNGAAIPDRETLHAFLRRELDLPEWYGHNLDALYDCLTGELTEATGIVLHQQDALLANLGGYGTVFLRVLREAEEENPLLHVEFPDDYVAEED